MFAWDFANMLPHTDIAANKMQRTTRTCFKYSLYLDPFTSASQDDTRNQQGVESCPELVPAGNDDPEQALAWAFHEEGVS